MIGRSSLKQCGFGGAKALGLPHQHVPLEIRKGAGHGPRKSADGFIGCAAESFGPLSRFKRLMPEAHDDKGSSAEQDCGEAHSRQPEPLAAHRLPPQYRRRTHTNRAAPASRPPRHSFQSPCPGAVWKKFIRIIEGAPVTSPPRMEAIRSCRQICLSCG